MDENGPFQVHSRAVTDGDHIKIRNSLPLIAYNCLGLNIIMGFRARVMMLARPSLTIVTHWSPPEELVTGHMVSVA